MNRKFAFVVLLVIALGFIITLGSLSYEQNLSIPGMSKFGYGFPLSWCMKTQVVYPGTPVTITILWLYFALDISFWSIIVAMPTAFIMYWKKKSKVFCGLDITNVIAEPKN
ncbi:MAG: hypothetical protein OEY10_05475 [Nitrosopumilus sp.]|nr:hypothetical protein [Candidatus Bathyarchaeota archaeon]MDH5665729.1 hypothetical protein [Nitrosopumilus sp.]